jgi:preprotein translocase subunit SecG
MSTLLVVLHVLVCIFLIAVVLLQRGKGAEIGAVFGSGASSTVFGSRGAGNFLTKLTTASAVIFMLTSLSLSYLWTPSGSDRLFDEPAAAGENLAPAEEPLFEEVEPPPAQPESSPAVPAVPEPAREAETN